MPAIHVIIRVFFCPQSVTVCRLGSPFTKDPERLAYLCILNEIYENNVTGLLFNNHIAVPEFRIPYIVKDNIYTTLS